MHDASRSRDKAWAFLAGWEGLIRAVALILICKDCSTGITLLGIMVFNQGGRTQVPERKAIDALTVFIFAFNSFRFARHMQLFSSV